MPVVVEPNMVFIDPDLDGDTRAVVAVHQCIMEHFAYGISREQETIDPLNAFVADVSLHVLRHQKVESLLSLFEQVTVYLVLVREIRLASKEADLDIGSGNELFRVLMKEQNTRVAEVFAFP